MIDRKNEIQLRFKGKRPNTIKAEKYVSRMGTAGYTNKTQFAEDAIVFYFEALMRKNDSKPLVIERETSGGEKTSNQPGQPVANTENEQQAYEKALQYIDEEAKRRGL